MKKFGNIRVIAVDHGYGNIKTANTVTPVGVTASKTEPIFSGSVLEYEGVYYHIGGGRKEFIADKALDGEAGGSINA
jgi:plasmid segregation protein ParM